MLKRIALTALLVLVASIGLASCGSDDSSAPSSQLEQTPTNSNPARKTEGSSPPKLSGDGLYFGYVMTATSEPPTISFDVAQFFFGKAVQKAAEEDGAVPPGEPVANDHHERNPDRRARELKVHPDAHVTAAPPASILMGYVSRRARAECYAEDRTGTPCTQIPLSMATFFTALKRLEPASYGIPVWITIREGRVARIDEQYFP